MKTNLIRWIFEFNQFPKRCPGYFLIYKMYVALLLEWENDKTKIEIIRSFDKVLALDLLPNEKKLTEDHEEIMKLIEQRNEAKKDKDFELADSIRDSLYAKGIKLIDTREGTTYTEV